MNAASASPERADEPRRASLGTRPHDLDRRPRAAPTERPPRCRARAASDDGQIAREHAHGPAEPGPLQRDIADVVVRRPILAMRPDGSRATRTISPRSPRARTPPAAFPPPRRYRPPAMSSHVRYRDRLSPPTNIATRSPNASTIAAAVAGTGTASGTNTIARRPPSMHRRDRVDGDGDLVLRSRPNHERSRPPMRARTRARRRCGTDEESGETSAGVARPIAAPRGRRRPILGLLTDATRGGTARPITAANGATYRSLTHRNSASMSSSKKRTGDTTFFTLSVRVPNDSEGPSTHPRINRPWNGTCTSDPLRHRARRGRT